MQFQSIFSNRNTRHTSVFALLFCSLLAATSCKKEAMTDEPIDTETAIAETFTLTKQQNPTFLYFGATWCYTCGLYGKPVSEQLAASPKNQNVSFVFYHINDAFGAPESDNMAFMLGVHGYPDVYIGGRSYGFGGATADDAAYKQGYLDAVRTASPVVCNTQMKASVGTAIDIEYKTKFWAAAQDSLYINFIAVESKLYAEQSNDASQQKNIHDFVFRAQSGTFTPYGDLLTTKAAKDQILKKTAKITYNSAWKKANMQVVAIVWRRKNGRFTVVNSDKIKL